MIVINLIQWIWKVPAWNSVWSCEEFLSTVIVKVHFIIWEGKFMITGHFCICVFLQCCLSRVSIPVYFSLRNNYSLGIFTFLQVCVDLGNLKKRKLILVRTKWYNASQQSIFMSFKMPLTLLLPLYLTKITNNYH